MDKKSWAKSLKLTFFQNKDQWGQGYAKGKKKKMWLFNCSQPCIYLLVSEGLKFNRNSSMASMKLILIQNMRNNNIKVW